MQFLTSLFGGSGNSILTAILALAIVLVLLMLAVWGLKALSNASRGAARGRNRRLAVVDSLALDPKRQLLIVRRDNVEHLILTGAQHDIIVESGIPVEPQQPRMPARRAPAPMAARPAPQPAPTPQTAAPTVRPNIDARAAAPAAAATPT